MVHHPSLPSVSERAEGSVPLSPSQRSAMESESDSGLVRTSPSPSHTSPAKAKQKKKHRPQTQQQHTADDPNPFEQEGHFSPQQLSAVEPAAVGEGELPPLPPSSSPPHPPHPHHIPATEPILVSDEQWALDDLFLHRSVYVLACSMMFIIFMYAPIQNVVTTIYPGTATVSLALIYAFFMVICPVAPSIVRKMGPTNGLILASTGYLLYTTGCLSANAGFFLFCSILGGLGAGLLWTSNGATITMLSNSSNRGMHSSFVIGFTRCAAVVANLSLGYMLNTANPDGSLQFSNSTLFGFFLSMGSLGFLGFLFLRVRMRKVKTILERREEEAKEAAAREAEELTKLAMERGEPAPALQASPLLIVRSPSLLQRFVEIFKIFFAPHYRHIAPILFLCQGFSNGYFFGSFGVVMGRSYLGFAQATMGIAGVCSIFGLGHLMDKIPIHQTHRKKWLLYGTLTAHLLFSFFTMLTAYYCDGYTSKMPEAEYPTKIGRPAFGFLVYTSCILYGIAWCGTDICHYVIIGQLFTSRSETAFSAKAFSESLGFVVAEGLIELFPKELYPGISFLWIIPVILWYIKWDFPVELLQSAAAGKQPHPKPITAQPVEGAAAAAVATTPTGEPLDTEGVDLNLSSGSLHAGGMTPPSMTSRSRMSSRVAVLRRLSDAGLVPAVVAEAAAAEEEDINRTWGSVGSDSFLTGTMPSSQPATGADIVGEVQL